MFFFNCRKIRERLRIEAADGIGEVGSKCRNDLALLDDVAAGAAVPSGGPDVLTLGNRFELAAFETVAASRSLRRECQVRLSFVYHYSSMTPALRRDNRSYYDGWSAFRIG
jgi:hypothetical protein